MKQTKLAVAPRMLSDLEWTIIQFQWSAVYM